eukprot:comp17452_c0_seq1/m.16880 comp17452_c0_seq1/g.16880  ORF comp17452_c0_seq1/g.16880 comp17452_c0_seq1/m.16880 type:complete len:402 (-) comp17452_c0_seq1:325-1530(-)
MANPRRHYDRLTLSALHVLSHDRSHAVKGIHPATLRHYLTTHYADSLGLRWAVSVARQLRQLETKGDVLVVGSGAGKRYRLSPSTRRHLNRTPLNITTPSTPKFSPKRTSVPTTPCRASSSTRNSTSTALKATTGRVHVLEQQRREAVARARDSARELSFLRQEHNTLLARLADHTTPTTTQPTSADTGVEDSALEFDDVNPPTPMAPSTCGGCADAEGRVGEARAELEKVQEELHMAVARAQTAEEKLAACQAELEASRTALAQTEVRVGAVEAERDTLAGRLRDVSMQLDDVTGREAAQRLAADAARAHVVGVLGVFGRLQDAANLLGGTPLPPSIIAQSPTPMEIQVEAQAGDDEGRPPSPSSVLIGLSSVCRSQSVLSDGPVPFLTRKSTEVILSDE